MNIGLLLTIVAGLILTVGDIVLKKWVTNSYTSFYVIGLLLYLVSMALLAQSYKFEDIAVASMLMVLFNIITLTIVGYFFFNEHITIYELAGLGMGAIALLLLEFGK